MRGFPRRIMIRLAQPIMIGCIASLGSGGLRPPGASRCSARKLAARSFPPRPPAYVLSRTTSVSRHEHGV